MLRKKALHYIQRYFASTLHFGGILKRYCKKFEGSQQEYSLWIAEMTEEFIQLGFLNDSKIAQDHIQLWRRKGLSGAHIEAKLYHKGLPKTEYSPCPKAEEEAALRWLAKKSGCKKTQTAQMQAMMRAGFSYDLASRLLRKTQVSFKEE